MSSFEKFKNDAVMLKGELAQLCNEKDFGPLHDPVGIAGRGRHSLRHRAVLR